MIPLVTHGVTTISRLQVWTQPIWLLMLIVPLAYVLHQHPGVLSDIWRYGGQGADGSPHTPGSIPWMIAVVAVVADLAAAAGLAMTRLRS